MTRQLGNCGGMSEVAKFEPYLTKKGWCLSIPPSMTATRKRERKFFSKKSEAEKAGAKLRGAHSKGVRGTVVSAMVVSQAMEAVRILEGSGVSLVEAARMAVAKGADPRGGETFQVRFDRVVATGELAWSDCYAGQISRVPRWLGKEGMKARCASLSEARVEELLRAASKANKRALSAGTLRMRKARVLAILGERATKRAPRRRSEIRLLSGDEMEAMFAAAGSKEQRWALGLLVFAGLRPGAEHGEVARLDWKDVGTEHVYVPPETSKTGTDRHIPMTPALARAIEGHPEEGAVRPANWKREWARIRKSAGIEKAQDVTRHTFASHFLAWQGEHAAKQAMGHTAGSATLFRHYRRAVTEEAGRGFFE